MKKNIQIKLIIAIIGIIATLNVFHIIKNNVTFSNFALANLEVLAQNENGDNSGRISSCYPLLDYEDPSGTITVTLCSKYSTPTNRAPCKSGRVLFVSGETKECYWP